MTVQRRPSIPLPSSQTLPRAPLALPFAITPLMVQSSLRVSLVVGTLLFAINHGAALSKGEMSRDRWLSGILTYCIPFSVSLHGQCMSRRRWARSVQD